MSRASGGGDDSGESNWAVWRNNYPLSAAPQQVWGSPQIFLGGV